MNFPRWIFVIFLLAAVLTLLMHADGAASLMAERTREPTPTDGPTPTPTVTPTPTPYANLLVNPHFGENFENWNRLNGIWKMSVKCSNPNPDCTAVELDQDTGRFGPVGWLYGDEDWLWQDASTLDVHTRVVFTITEIHHNYDSVAEVRLFGSFDGETWEEIWYRPDLSSIPTAITAYDWYTNSYAVLSIHPFYRLEFHGLYLSEDGQDGWKITNLDLHVEP